MKASLNSFLAILGLLIFNLSCKKNNDIPSSILGKWNIKIDTSFTGSLALNHMVIYSGEPGDYFYFNSDGHLYIKESSILDTLTYTLSSDSVLIENFTFGYEGKCLFNLSTHNLIISSGYFWFYGGGAFGRTVYLYR